MIEIVWSRDGIAGIAMPFSTSPIEEEKEEEDTVRQ